MIAIVSGLPRSGTSLMMRMLAAGGLTPLTDQIRTADADNPRGYYEWENVKQLPVNPGLIKEAEGKVVKIVSSLLIHLPVNHEYRIVFMRRPLQQVVASQAAMLQRRSHAGASVSPAAMQAALGTHLSGVTAWLAARSSLLTRWVDYPELVARPLEHAVAIADFLGGGLEPARMSAEVDPALFRRR